MESLLQDMKFGAKLLWKEKGFTVTALLTLALCIGANSAIFSVINTVLLRPLPFEDPDRLVIVFNSYPGAGAPIASNASGDYFFRRDGIEAFEECGLYQNWGHTVGEPGSTERMLTMRVTPSFFPMLGVEPLIGRGFTEEEMDTGNESKAILSYGLWQERYDGSQDVLGEEIRINGSNYSIIGVMPEEFRFLGNRDNRLYVPIPIDEEDRGINSLHSNSYQMIAKLRPGATTEQATAQHDVLNASLTEQSPIPNAAQLLEDTGFHTEVHRWQHFILRDIRPTFYMLWAGVFFVLLIGCVNIANLMLARSNVRMHELSTRAALGAGRMRLTRQIITESVMLAVAGGVLGLAVGSLGLRFLEVMGTDQLPQGTEISMDTSALLFTLIISVGAGVFFGVIPLVSIFRQDITNIFRQEGRTGTAGKGAIFLRSFLVVAQVTIAFWLLIGAGLMFTSFRRVLDVDPGFDQESVLTGFVSLPGPSYPNDSSRMLFTDRLLEEVRALPGVEEAGVTSFLPFSGNNNSSVIVPEGYEPQPGESVLSPFNTICGPGYFKAMGIPLLEGRYFDETDTEDTPNKIIIDEWLARRYWPDSSPLGKRMLQGVEGMEEMGAEYFTIIGVVGQIKQNELTTAEDEHSGAYYFTYKQNPIGFMVLTVRTAIEPLTLTNPIRSVVSSIDGDLPFYGVETMEQRIEDSLLVRRSPMLLLIIFAVVALFLAAIGIYGVMAYSVTQRTRELGIRVALGSSPQQLFRRVVWQGMIVMLVGLVVGIILTVFTVGLIRSMLFGVQPLDPTVFISVSIILTVVALLACILPARRATRIDPVASLNYE